MTYATASTMEFVGSVCSNCNDHLEVQAKFCGSCGFIVAPSSFNILQFPEQHARYLNYEQSQAEAPQSLPSFAMPKTFEDRGRSDELEAEVNKVMVLLAREKIFLIIHSVTFLAINLFGCWVAWKCYADFIGDEMSKMMIASTPFLFINSIALMMLVPIKGTRAEIARLKEKLSYVRFNLEFGHLKL